jgi:hypothetical protein
VLLQVFVYLAGLQLLLTSGRKSVLVMVASTLAGVLYRANFCGVRRLRVSSGALGPLQQPLLGSIASQEARQLHAAAGAALHTSGLGEKTRPTRVCVERCSHLKQWHC